ncbi:hypothetical protein GCM10014713_67160 [Streptomyces purpureus]|uniref:Uncharacterized protein n=1 Tax=Streptomyces purpureus TaxID=1951 RepID=A0A918LWZ7_9ACTN|nr:hypothetical protein GCM10014713_67160 [Streptomyces purpureus]
MYDGSTGKQYTPRAPPCPQPAARIPERRMRGAFAADVRCTNIAMAGMLGDRPLTGPDGTDPQTAAPGLRPAPCAGGGRTHRPHPKKRPCVFATQGHRTVTAQENSSASSSGPTAMGEGR